MTKQIKKTFAEIMREIRKSKGLSQKELARKSELHVNTIYLLEIGEIEAKFSTLFFLSKGLGLDLDELVRLFVKKYFNR